MCGIYVSQVTLSEVYLILHMKRLVLTFPVVMVVSDTNDSLSRIGSSVTVPTIIRISVTLSSFLLNYFAQYGMEEQAFHLKDNMTG